VCTCTLGSRAVSGASLPAHTLASVLGLPTAFQSLPGLTSVAGLSDPGAGDPDQLTFTFQRVSGDIDISACVGLKLMFDPSASAGLMMRDSLEPDARSASLLYTPARALAFQTRSSAGPTDDYTAAAIPGPCLRLVRRGDIVSAYQLTTSDDWLPVGEPVVMSGALYLGVALSSGGSAATLFSDVTLLALSGDGVLSSNLWAWPGSVLPEPGPSSTTPPAEDPPVSEPLWAALLPPAPDPAAPLPTAPVPTAPLPEAPPLSTPDPPSAPAPTGPAAPDRSEYLSGTATEWWSVEDIGEVQSSAADDTVDTLLSLAGAGGGIGGEADAFHYVYQAISGDVDFVARIVDFRSSNEAAQLGLMVRESLDPRAPHATVAVSAAGDVEFRRRHIIAGPTVTTASSGTLNPAWLRVRRQGDLFDAFWSNDRTGWNRVIADALVMGPVVYVGFALASGSPDALATAQLSDNQLLWRTAVNQFPQVKIDWTPGGSWAPGSVLTIPVSAVDADGTIARVDFYANGILLGSDFAAPHVLEWTAQEAGDYDLVAVAQDNDGQGTTSSRVRISVSAALPLPEYPVPDLLTPPRTLGHTYAVFNPAPDHDENVAHYLVELHRESDSETDAPVGVLDIGKPTPSNNTIEVDITATTDALPSGSYYVVVTAVSPSGPSAGARSTVFSR
jgi:hypothetical protein